jgi:hypothetical protein
VNRDLLDAMLGSVLRSYTVAVSAKKNPQPDEAYEVTLTTLDGSKIVGKGPSPYAAELAALRAWGSLPAIAGLVYDQHPQLGVTPP